jgi:DNA mismatch repair protein MutS2
VEEAQALLRSARRALRLASDRVAAGAGPRPPGEGSSASPGREVEALAGELKVMAARIAPHAPPPSGPPGDVAPERVRPGESYWVPDLGALVEVVEPPDSSGRVVVRRRGLRVELAVERLKVAGAEMLAADRSESRVLTPPQQLPEVDVGAPPGFEIDLRGMTGDEAVTEVARYVEQATVHGLTRIRIIRRQHRALRARRSSLPPVVLTRLGEIPEGGSGVTVANIA